MRRPQVEDRAQNLEQVLLDVVLTRVLRQPHRQISLLGLQKHLHSKIPIVADDFTCLINRGPFQKFLIHEAQLSKECRQIDFVRHAKASLYGGNVLAMQLPHQGEVRCSVRAVSGNFKVVLNPALLTGLHIFLLLSLQPRLVVQVFMGSSATAGS